MAKRIKPLGSVRPIVRFSDSKNIKEREILEKDYESLSVFTDDVVENILIIQQNPFYLKEYERKIYSNNSFCRKKIFDSNSALSNFEEDEDGIRLRAL